MQGATRDRSGENAPVGPVAPMVSRLFFAVVVSGITFGAAACTVASAPTDIPPAPAASGREPVRTEGEVPVDSPDASSTRDAALDAAPEAAAHVEDAGWHPTK
jgi:hypothetical protein